jgi:serine/threonine protein phosphatase PrpC
MRISLHNESFSIEGFTLAEKGKFNCGDSIGAGIVEGNNQVVVALSDGVSTRPADYLASQTACNSFIDFFNFAKQEFSVERFILAIKSADKEVSNPENQACKGMMCTFIGAVSDTDKNSIIYDSIGDSRLYKYDGIGILQLSKDEKKAVILRDRSGKPMQSNGFVFNGEGITNALGYSNVEVHPSVAVFNSGEALIFCSDGAYQVPGFNESVLSLLEYPDLSFAVEKFLNQFKDMFADDASMIILRNDVINEEVRQKAISLVKGCSDFRESRISAFMMALIIQYEIINALTDLNKTYIEQLTSYAEKFNLKFSESFINETIHWMKKPECFYNPLYKLLLKRLRELK